jgi:hypothetical protein
MRAVAMELASRIALLHGAHARNERGDDQNAGSRPRRV